MNKLVNRFSHPFGIGFLASFLGTLPLGILNVMTFNIAYHDGWLNSLLFGTGVTLVETIYAFVLLQIVPLEKLSIRSKQLLNVIMLVFLSFLTYQSFQGYLQPDTNRFSSLLLHGNFITGITYSALNLLQIPFWLGLNAVVIHKGIVHRGHISCYPYLTGIASGTLGGLLLFLLLGISSGGFSAFHTEHLQLITAFTFLITLLLLFIRSIIQWRVEVKKL